VATADSQVARSGGERACLGGAAAAAGVSHWSGEWWVLSRMGLGREGARGAGRETEGDSGLDWAWKREKTDGNSRIKYRNRETVGRMPLRFPFPLPLFFPFFSPFLFFLPKRYTAGLYGIRCSSGRNFPIPFSSIAAHQNAGSSSMLHCWLLNAYVTSFIQPCLFYLSINKKVK